jgi:hypothetical protein
MVNISTMWDSIYGGPKGNKFYFNSLLYRILFHYAYSPNALNEINHVQCPISVNIDKHKTIKDPLSILGRREKKHLTILFL